MRDPELCLYVYCDNEIVDRRSDALFCSLKCKNTHHHTINRGKRLKITGPVDKCLHKNRDILEAYYSKSKGLTAIPLVPLIEQGFKCRIFTGRASIDQAKNDVYAYYNFAIKYTDNNTIIIYRKDEGFHNI